MRGSPRSSSVVALSMLVWAGSAAAELTIPKPNRFVVDRAGIIDPVIEQRLEGWLAELSQKTTANVKVLTVPTIEGQDFFDFV
ncbi:MAG: TPM domain-containing protein, partial [Planctomycetota bacterium]